MLYLPLPDSVDYFLTQYDKKTKDDYKKMLMIATVRSLQNIVFYEKKDTSIYKSKHYTDFTDWKKIESIYAPNKGKLEYDLIYQSIKTYLILFQSAIVDKELVVKYSKELTELEKYYLDMIKDKKCKNKLVPYLSLSSIYFFQKQYDKAVVMHHKALDFAKKYEVLKLKDSEELIGSYIGLLEVSKKYKEGIALLKELIAENEYNVFYRKAYVYFLYESGYSDEIKKQTAQIVKYKPNDAYPYLVNAYEEVKKNDLNKMFEELKTAYAKDPSAPEIFGLIAVMNIVKGDKKEALKNLSYIEEAMPETAEKIRKFIK